MTSHRTPHHPSWRRLLTSVRVRALLSLGIALGIGTTGTLAAWSDDVVVNGGTFTSGTLDLQVNDADAYAATLLSMTAMVPGNTSAQVLTIKNNGTAPLKYSLTGGLTGTDAATFGTAAALTLTIRAGGAKSGTGNSSTCTGGTSIYSSALTATATTAIIPTTGRRGPLVAAGTDALCFQVTFDANASTTLQNKTATATFTASATSDVS
jgi:predicted ribosomally synthesized peptide with SipW-like signal peptide